MGFMQASILVGWMPGKTPRCAWSPETGPSTAHQRQANGFA